MEWRLKVMEMKTPMCVALPRDAYFMEDLNCGMNSFNMPGPSH